MSNSNELNEALVEFINMQRLIKTKREHLAL